MKKRTLPEFITLLAGDLTASGRHRTLRAYQSTCRSIQGFAHRSELPLNAVFTKNYLRRYEEYLLHVRHLQKNTSSFYLRMLRSLYNQARKRGCVRSVPGLFDHVFTGLDDTPKRAIPAAVIAQIVRADFTGEPTLEYARDLFALSLQLQGMPFVDLTHLRENDLRGNIITYHRRKTRGMVTVAVLPETQGLLCKYTRNTSSGYLLPVLEGHTSQERERSYQTALRAQNRNLKKIAARLGITEKLTSYVARHSWATIAHHSGVKTSLISQAMGHRNTEITHTYLSAFGNKELTEANRMVLEAVWGSHRDRRV